MAIEDFPDELLDAILSNLDHDDLKNSRLVSRRWKRVAIGHLFRTIPLHPTISGFKNWRRCFDDSEIRAAARRLVVHTTDKETNVNCLEDGLDTLAARAATEAELGNFDALSLIAKFPRVTELSIVFSPLCIGETSGMVCYSVESVEQRRKALQDIFKAVGKRNRKTDVTKINTLAIQNMQNVRMRSFTSSTAFKQVMEHIEHLDLHVITEKTEGFVNEMAHPERWTFEPHLQQAWVVPLAPQLVSLSLAFDELSYWGTIPGTFDPKGVAFPKLEELSLTRYAVSHHDHLNWVLETPSLRKLVLDECRIVCNVWMSEGDRAEWNVATHDWLRIPHETYHFDPRDPSEGNALYHFPGTWEDVFDKIRRQLPNLEEFKFDIPWASRYVAFQARGWPTPWTWADEKGNMQYGHGHGIKGHDVLNRARETNQGDCRALDELRTAVNGGPAWLVRGKRKRRIRGKEVGLALIKPLSPLLELWRYPSRWLIRRFGCPVCQGLEDPF